MSNLIKFYFEGLFTYEVDEPIEEVVDKVQLKVTTEMNNDLLAPFTAEEVKMHCFKLAISKFWVQMGCMLSFIRCSGYALRGSD
jgi:hypothetical protein